MSKKVAIHGWPIGGSLQGVFQPGETLRLECSDGSRGFDVTVPADHIAEIKIEMTGRLVRVGPATPSEPEAQDGAPAG